MSEHETEIVTDAQLVGTPAVSSPDTATLVLGGSKDADGWPWDSYSGWQARYLESLSAGNGPTVAGIDAGVSESTPYKAMRRDPAFAKACEHAKQVGATYNVDRVEARSLEGALADSFPDRKLWLQGNCARYKPASAQVTVNAQVQAGERTTIDTLAPDQLVALQVLAHQRLMRCAGQDVDTEGEADNDAAIETQSQSQQSRGPSTPTFGGSEGSETDRVPCEVVLTPIETESQKNSGEVEG